MKIFQIVAGMCHWLTPFKSIGETVGKFPADCLFVEAPDYVHESWGYQDKDADGNPITGDDRFIKPTPPEGWLYDDATGTFYPEEEEAKRLELLQKVKQEENKNRFAEFLSKNPITWIDGKLYGVTLEDQTEINLNINQYKIQIEAGVENPVLEWHAVHEASVPWKYEDLCELVAAINEFVYPWFKKMNDYKEAIYAATSNEEVAAIEIIFGDPEEAEESEEITEE